MQTLDVIVLVGIFFFLSCRFSRYALILIISLYLIHAFRILMSLGHELALYSFSFGILAAIAFIKFNNEKGMSSRSVSPLLNRGKRVLNRSLAVVVTGAIGLMFFSLFYLKSNRPMPFEKIAWDAPPNTVLLLGFAISIISIFLYRRQAGGEKND